jgi:hypothetical protein
MPEDAQKLPIDVLQNVHVSIEVRIRTSEHSWTGAGTATLGLPASGSSLDELGDRLGPSLQPLVDAAFQDYLDAQAKEGEGGE